MEGRRCPPRSCHPAVALLILLFGAHRAAQAHTHAAVETSSWLHHRQLKQIGQQATVPTFPVRACGTITPAGDMVQAALNATKAKTAELANQTAIESSALITINVYFHVISAGPALADGNVPDQWIVAQINTMNKAYGATGFQFDLVNISRTVNADWYGMAPQSPEELAAKTLLHSGNMRDFNLYTNAGGGNGLLGWTYFPFQNPGVLDSSVIYWNSLPGGSAGGGQYGLGMTAVHESGHWMGLFHTFQGGCPPQGDYVSDTAAEGTPSYACVPRDSCPGDGLADPINNFMDYSNDACMTTFTPGQATRMLSMWQTYRAISPVLPTGPLLLASPTTAAGTAASAAALKAPSPSPHPKPKPNAPQPKSTSKPTPKSTPKPTSKPKASPQPSIAELAPYAQCGGIAGSPICNPHCTDAAWSTTRCRQGTCHRSSGWYWQCVP